MTVISSTIWQVKPGRQPDMIERVGAARKIHQRLGVNARAWSVAYAGPNSGRVAYTMEFADNAAWAAAIGAMQADSEWLNFTPTVWGADGPATSLGNVLFRVLPEHDAPAPAASGGPRVSTLHSFSVERGRLAEARALLAEGIPERVRLGAQRARTVIPMFAGPGPLTLTVGSEYADLAACAATMDRAATDAQWLARQTRVITPGSPLSLLATVLRVEIP